jgi:uncharacterized protein YceK
MNRALAALLVLGMSLSSGCASLLMTAGAPTPYGGTRVDVAALKPQQYELLPRWMCAVDLAPSFALDTAFLPYTVTRAALK